MAGRGPARKPADKRARRNAPPSLALQPIPQPELPEGIPWPDATVEWWAVWGASPLTRFFSATDWAYLQDTALIHADYWGGNLDRAAELRQRTAEIERRGQLQAEVAAYQQPAEQKAPEPEPEAQPEAPAGGRYASVTPLHAVG